MADEWRRRSYRVAASYSWADRHEGVPRSFRRAARGIVRSRMKIDLAREKALATSETPGYDSSIGPDGSNP